MPLPAGVGGGEAVQKWRRPAKVEDHAAGDGPVHGAAEEEEEQEEEEEGEEKEGEEEVAAAAAGDWRATAATRKSGEDPRDRRASRIIAEVAILDFTKE